MASATIPAISATVRGSAAHFGEAAERGDLVDLLERLATAEAALDLTGDHEHRGRVLARRVDPDGEVRRPDRSCREADGRPTGQLPVRLGHEGRRTFVARGDDPDPGALEGVEQPQERLTRHGERIAHARRAQGVGDEPTDGARTDRDDRLDLRLRLGVRAVGVGGSLGVSDRFDGDRRSRLGIRGFRRLGRRLVGGFGGHLVGRLRRQQVGLDRLELGHGDCAPSSVVAPRGDGQR